MDLASFKSAQKLRYFLAGVFPFLARVPWPRAAIVAWFDRHPRIAAAWARLRGSPVGAHAERVASTFTVGEYDGDVLDWTTIPRESIGVLRAVVVVATLLCLLVPLAIRVDWPAIPIESITGVPDRGAVGGWAISFWIVAWSLGWACFLVGTAASSRIAFIPALAVFLYFAVVTVAAQPKSWWNVCAALQGVLAAVFCEFRSRSAGRPDAFAGLVTSLLAGAGAGFVGMIVIPTEPWFRGRMLLAIASVGLPLGMLVWATGRAFRRRAERTGGGLWGGRADVVVGTLGALGLVAHMALALRGGIAIPAQGISGLSIQMTGYLWPWYYFIGVGVVFKVLRQTKTVQRAVQDVVPSRVAVPATVALLVVLTLVAWARPVLLAPAAAWPGWIVASADWITDTFWFVWSTQVTRLAMETMQWIALGMLCVSVWGLVRRRVDATAISTVQVTLLVSWLAVAEYHFEMLGLTHSAKTSAIALFIFVVFVLWLVHRTTMRFLVGDSLWWPRGARTMLYGACLMFVLLPVHARAAMHDPRLTGEIFLYLFQGVLNFGVPYYLYLYASRRFRVLPLAPHAALGLFLLGGLLSAALVVADKAVVAGSLSEAWAMAGSRVADLLAGRRSLASVIVLPPWWTVVRGVVTLGTVVLVTAVVRRRVQTEVLRPAASVFAAVAVAAGLACFSNRALELPLVPNQVEVLLTPLRQSLTLDSAFVALQLSYVLPALLLGVFWMRETTTGRAGAGVVAAIALHVAIALSWPGAEAWLRSTGAFAAAATAGVCSFLLLVAAVRERLDAVLAGQREAENEGAPPSQIVRWPELRAAGIALLFICGTLAVARGYTGRLVAHDGPARASRVWLPASWRASVSAASPAASRFALGSASGDSAVLTLETRPDTSATPLLAAQAVALEVGTRFAGFAPASLEGWDRFAPGAVAVEFSYYRQPEDSNSFALGTLAVVPAGEGSVLVATVTYGTQDTPRRWDVARLLSRLRESEVSAQRLGVSREGAPRRAAAAGRSPRASG